MKQLVQLQERYDEFKTLDAEIINVHREDKLGLEGLKKIHEKQGIKFVLLTDHQNKKTPAYSQGAFFTYIIDKQGVIRSLLPGTVYDRPHGKTILESLQQVVKEAK